jgi:hypothetical protein
MIVGDASSLGLKNKNNIKHFPENFVGKSFGKLIVLSLHEERRYNSNGHITREMVFNVQCGCGKPFTVGQRRLLDGRSRHCRKCASTTKSNINPGDKFNRWTVISETEQIKSHRMFICRCECGNTGKVAGSMLTRRKVNGCIDCGNKDKIKHGMSFSCEYMIWRSLRERCNNKKHPSYYNYGGRGINVSKEWDDFNTFLNDMGKKPFDKAEIDRVDNEKGYSKENCEWVTRKQNHHNRRNSKKNRDKYMYILKDKLCDNCREIK